MTHISVMNVVDIQIGQIRQIPSRPLEQPMYTVDICIRTNSGEFHLVAFSDSPEPLKIDLKKSDMLGVAA